MKPKCCVNVKSLKEIVRTADYLKVIAEVNRIKILCALKAGERCVCDIWQDLDIPQNLASHHLKVLKDASLIDFRKEGLKIIYRINKNEMNKLISSLSKFLRAYGE